MNCRYYPIHPKSLTRIKETMIRVVGQECDTPDLRDALPPFRAAIARYEEAFKGYLYDALDGMAWIDGADILPPNALRPLIIYPLARRVSKSASLIIPKSDTEMVSSLLTSNRGFGVVRFFLRPSTVQYGSFIKPTEQSPVLMQTAVDILPEGDEWMPQSARVHISAASFSLPFRFDDLTSIDAAYFRQGTHSVLVRLRRRDFQRVEV